MAAQVNTAEVGNDVIDLTTDDCSEVILPKELMNQVDNDVNDTEVDVEFLGSCVRCIPVITISDSDILEDDNYKNTDTKPEKSRSRSTSQCLRKVTDYDIFSNKCALNDINSHILKAGSTTHYEDLTEKPESCGNLKRKSGFCEKIKSEQMKIMKTAGKVLLSEKQSVAEATMTSECSRQMLNGTNSKSSMQDQTIKNEISTEMEYPKNKISSREVGKEHGKNGSKVHIKKPKIKVRIIMKKPVLGINKTEPRETLVEESVKTETGAHNMFCFPLNSVARKDEDSASSVTINHGSHTPGTENTVNKKYLELNKNACFNKSIDQVNIRERKSITKCDRKEEINNINAVKNQSKMVQSDSLHQTRGNGDCEDNKIVSRTSKETSNNIIVESSSACSQLAIHSAKFPPHAMENGRMESDSNGQIQCLPSASTADEQNEASTSEVQLLPARMTITECGNQVVYAVPLLRLPVQRQIVYFSPEYIEIFIKKVRDVFCVNKFLHAIPDPFRYFRKEKNNENKYNDECLALMYLKSKYRKIPFPDIAFTFEKNKYSLTLTCDELDVWTSSQRTTARKFGLGCGCPNPHELSMAFVHEVSIHELQCCEFLRITV